ncbi:MAG: hypothetical protein WC655_00050 [Candidatus Hydrogenedentales bacterium]|jgi:hypothetical protein
MPFSSLSRNVDPACRRIVPLVAIALAVIVSHSGCSPWRPSAKPLTTGQLISLMPDQCSTALVFPSFDGAYQALLLLLDRAAPENVDINVEAQVLARPLATLAGESGATDIIDIAMGKGVDPALPLTIFLAPGQATAPETPEPAVTPDSMINPAALFTRINDRMLFVAVLPRYSQKFMEQAVADWSKGKAVRQEPLAGNAAPLQVREDGRLCWYFTPEGLVAGNSVELAKAVAARAQQPAAIAYNAADVEKADLIQIVRGAASALTDSTQEESGPLALVSRMFSALLAAPDPATPSVVAWRIGETSLEATVRRPESKEKAAALQLAPLLPTSATGFAALSMTDAGKSLMQELVGSLGVQQSLPGDARSMLESLDGELAVAATKGSPGRPNIVLLAHIGEGQARETLKSAASALAVENYNGVSIVSIPIPGGTNYQVQYALVGDVLAVATEMGDVKTAVDRIQSGKPSGLFASLAPPLDPAAPPRMAIVANASFVSETFAPLLANRGVLPFERAETAAKALAKVSEFRVTTVAEGSDEVTRLTLHVQ